MTPTGKVVDFLVIGGGVAGLRAAIELADKGSVLVLTKDKITESTTGYAQGGIAVALSDEDKVGIHYDDTLNAGDGLCNRQAVRSMVEEGPEYILELISWGAEFDRKDSRLSFTMEAAHSRKRILHSKGDSTGKEIERVLINKVKSFSTVEKYDFAFTLDLIVKDGRCIGAVVLRGEKVEYIFAKAVILATGGVGRLFSRTTNPVISTGDGIAIAYRAGALIRDMELVQFHPTTLYSPGAPQFLLSEAMRGEGARLVNIRQERFMHNYHEKEELAPRDMVSRAIVSEMVRTNARHVYLDLRHLDSEFVQKRFPKIYMTCLQFDIDISEDLIPVCPAAHYIMGGVMTSLDGETSIKGLFAAGEVACTGVHGANRLASNSLLEGLVYGARAGKQAYAYAEVTGILESAEVLNYPEHLSSEDRLSTDLEKVNSMLRQVMWNKVGIIRCSKSLSAADKWLRKKAHLFDMPIRSRREAELQNQFVVARMITESALLRKGSVGAHYRSDCKSRGDRWERHVECAIEKGVYWAVPSASELSEETATQKSTEGNE
ncbi:MAG: L-aspartate oxidase [Nitrospira sp.]|nr:L-aspartate oxidase [bacterium]MBL7031632.1 L-aspartate oxidase [Nitrospira sp.]